MKDEKQLIDRLLGVHASFTAALRDQVEATGDQGLTTVEIFGFLTRRATYELEATLAAQDLVEHWAQASTPSLLETDAGHDGAEHKARITAAVDAIGPRADVSAWLAQHVQDCADREARVKADAQSASNPAFAQTFASERDDVERILGDLLEATQAFHLWNQERGSAAMISAFLQAGMNQPGATVSDTSYTNPDGTVDRTVSVTVDPAGPPGRRRPRWLGRTFRR